MKPSIYSLKIIKDKQLRLTTRKNVKEVEFEDELDQIARKLTNLVQQLRHLLFLTLINGMILEILQEELQRTVGIRKKRWQQK
jgi:flagellar biosynthesis/type III secretory pathway chaperone